MPLLMGIKLCVTNKYFIMFFLLAVFLSFYEAVTGTCNAYYAQYILGNRDLLGALASFESIPQVITVFESGIVCLRHAWHRQGLLPRRKIFHAG